jgi:hypothetical protein
LQCDSVGETISLGFGEAPFQCQQSDVLTADKQAFITNDLLPNAQSAIQAIVKVNV